MKEELPQKAWSVVSPQIIKFGFVGVLNTVLGYGIFLTGLYWLNLHYATALIIAYAIGIMHSYMWNKYWTFKSNNKIKKELAKFIAVYLVSLSANYLFLFLLVDIMHKNPAISQIFVLCGIAIVTFLGHKKWSFRST